MATPFYWDAISCPFTKSNKPRPRTVPTSLRKGCRAPTMRYDSTHPILSTTAYLWAVVDGPVTCYPPRPLAHVSGRPAHQPLSCISTVDDRHAHLMLRLCRKGDEIVDK